MGHASHFAAWGGGVRITKSTATYGRAFFVGRHRNYTYCYAVDVAKHPEFPVKSAMCENKKYGRSE